MQFAMLGNWLINIVENGASLLGRSLRYAIVAAPNYPAARSIASMPHDLMDHD